MSLLSLNPLRQGSERAEGGLVEDEARGMAIGIPLRGPII